MQRGINLGFIPPLFLSIVLSKRKKLSLLFGDNYPRYGEMGEGGLNL